MIPKLLQFHWFREPLPEWGKANLAEWRAAYPDWELRLVAAPPDDLPAEYHRLLERCPTPRLKADLERYWLLWRDGGVYADLDTRPLRKIEGLRGVPCFVPEVRLWQPDGPLVMDMCLLGSEPGHPFWQECLRRCAAATEPDWHWLGGLFGAEPKREIRRIPGVFVLDEAAVAVATEAETRAHAAGTREPLDRRGPALLKHYYHHSNLEIFAGHR